jgi:hypothetical protein
MKVPEDDDMISVDVRALTGTVMLKVPSLAVVTGPATVVVPLESRTTTDAPATGAANTDPDIVVVVEPVGRLLPLEPPQDAITMTAINKRTDEMTNRTDFMALILLGLRNLFL